MNKFVQLAFVSMLFSFSMPLFAFEIKLQQELQQGALVYGRTDADALEVLGRKVDVDAQGRFVFGLGRDAKPELSIVLMGPDGQSETKTMNVRQRRYETESIEGVEQKYVSPPAEVLERIRSDTAQVKKARETDSSNRYDYLDAFIWPAEGRISGVYGSQRIFNGVPKRPHYGIDIAAPTGAPVISPIAGKVILAHPDMYYSGGTLILDHGRGVSSTFIHLSRIHVKEGDEIEKGQQVGEVGASGRATGPHLDWRINWFQHRLDPQLVLPSREALKNEDFSH